MPGDRPLLPDTLAAELDLVIEEAPLGASSGAPQRSALWEDVSGNLHLRNPANRGRRAEDHLNAAAFDALSAGHALTLETTPDAWTRARHALIDDCDGRFVIDPSSGVISLGAPAEAGKIYAVRMRSIDAVGGAYESAFHLRAAAPLPEAVMPDGADPLAIATLFASRAAAPHPLMLAPPPPASLRAWSDISAAEGRLHAAPGARESAPFGAALDDHPLAFPAEAPAEGAFALSEEPPAPAPRGARWLHS